MSFQQKKQPFKLHLAVFGCVFIHVHPAQTWQTVQNENQRKQGSMSLPWHGVLKITTQLVITYIYKFVVCNCLKVSAETVLTMNISPPAQDQ